MDSQGNLERTLKVRKKVREFENKWLWQPVFRKLFILFKMGKDVHSQEIV